MGENSKDGSIHSRRAVLLGGSCSAGASLACARTTPRMSRPPEAGNVRIALAALRRGDTIPAGVEKIKSTLAECREARVQIVCFPECYLPGCRGGENDK